MRVDAADTATAAFVGEGPAGVRTRPVLVTNARELGRAFGSARCHLVDAARHFFANGGARLWVVPAAGIDSAPERAFARLDDLDCSLVASPGHGSGAVVEAGARSCERRGDRFFLADAPADAGLAWATDRCRASISCGTTPPARSRSSP